MEILKSNHALQSSLGAEVRLLTPAELRERFPWLEVADLAGGGPVMLDCFGDVAAGDVAVDADNVYWLGAETADGPGGFNLYTLRATPKQPR